MISGGEFEERGVPCSVTLRTAEYREGGDGEEDRFESDHH